MESRENDRVVRGEALGQQRYIWLRSTWGQDGVAHFYYSVNGDDFFPLGAPYQMSYGAFRGDRIGIYCFNNQAEAGSVDVDYFHYARPWHRGGE